MHDTRWIVALLPMTGPSLRRDPAQQAASVRRFGHKPALDVCGESESGEDVLFLKVQEVGQDLFVRHTRREVAENFIDSDRIPRSRCPRQDLLYSRSEARMVPHL